MPSAISVRTDFSASELRRIGWQRHKRDVGRHLQGLGSMPAGLVESQQGVNPRSQALTEVVQEDAHRGCRDARQHQRDILAALGPHGRIEPSRGKALIDQARRALALLIPAVTRPTFLANSGFVHKPQLHLGSSVRLMRCGEPEGQLLF